MVLSSDCNTGETYVTNSTGFNIVVKHPSGIKTITANNSECIEGFQNSSVDFVKSGDPSNPFMYLHPLIEGHTKVKSLQQINDNRGCTIKCVGFGTCKFKITCDDLTADMELPGI